MMSSHQAFSILRFTDLFEDLIDLGNNYINIFSIGSGQKKGDYKNKNI
mgnify:CR=1 FL=1